MAKKTGKDALDEDIKVDDTDDAPEKDEAAGEVVVDLEAVEEDTEADTTDDRLSRKGRRANRFREAQERAEAAERARAEAEERAARLQEAILLRLANGQPQSQQSEAKDPLDSKIESLREQRKRLRAQAAAMARAGMNIPDDLEADYERLEMEIAETVAEKRISSRREDPEESERRTVQRALQLQHPEVYGDPRATRWAKGRFEQLMADPSSAGKPEIAVVRQALMDAEVQFGFKRPSVSEGQKAKYAGRSAGASGAASPAKTVTLSKEERRMADTLYDHIKDPKKRYVEYARKVALKG